MDWNDVKERIRDSATIPDILESWYRVALNGRGRGRCPLCNYEKDKTVFWVSEKEQRFFCHHCKKGGNIFTLVMERENLDFKAALTRLANHAGIELEVTPEQEKEFKQEQERAATLFRFFKYANEKLNENDKARAYLKNRMIDIDYINDRLIGFIPDNATYQATYQEDKQDLHHLGQRTLPIFNTGPAKFHEDNQDLRYLKQMGLLDNDKKVTPKWCNRLIIPLWKNGQIVYFAGRSLDENVKPKQLFPSVKEMGNKPVVGTCKGDRVLIVEGAFDFLTADQEPGLKSVMAILGNSSIFELPQHIKTVELCFDWDKAGFEYIDKHGLHFASMGKTVKVVTRPNILSPGKKDLNDYVQEGGKIELLEKIDLAEWYLNQLKESPRDETVKKKFYKSILKVGLGEQEIYLNRLYIEILKGKGVGKRAITKEFIEFKKAEKDSNEQDTFTDVISGNDFKLPNGYAFKGDKLILTEKGEIISEKRIYISRLLTDTKESEFYCEIVSSYNNQTIASIEPLFILSNRKDIVLLSKKNFPVTSENAGKLVQFLDRFKYENEDKLKPLNASSQLGWQGDSFLFPDRALNGNGEIVAGHFIGSDPPRDAFNSKGDLNTYVWFIRDIKDDLGGDRWVIPVFVVYATLASFILELLNENPIIIHFTETTGRGKTSIMKLAASVYGKPDYFNNWNDTITGLGRKAVKLKNFPLLINEGSMIEQKKGIDAFLYTLSEGQSRTKATMDSTNETTAIKRFHNVIISNGETSLLTGNESSGVLMRVNEFFKTLGGINHNFIERLEGTIKENYGLLIEQFLKKVIELRDVKGHVNINRDNQKIEVKNLDNFPYFEPLDKTDNPNSGNLNRKIKSLQPVYIAGCIAEHLFNFGYDPGEVVGYVYDISKKYIEENINRAKRVINALDDFYQEHRNKFIDLSMIDVEGNEENINKAADGKNTCFGYKREKELLIIPEVFKNHFLKAFNGSDGKNQSVILRELREEGYIETERNRNQKMIRIGGITARAICFPNFFNCETDMPLSISNEWPTHGEQKNVFQ
jgi:DNA primase catalytic core